MPSETNPVVPYASPALKQWKTERIILPITVVLLALTALAMVTCVRIEILNAQLGYYLPRDFISDPGKWRAGVEITEARWRQRQAERNADPAWLVRPLTVAERDDFLRASLHNERNSDLRGIVSSWGLLQYPLVLVLLIALPLVFLRHQRRAWRTSTGVACVISLICACLMFYRGYMPSLGW